MTFNAKERGDELRRAINYSIKHNKVYYEKLSKNRWVAEVTLVEKRPVDSHHRTVNSQHTDYKTSFSIYFTPNTLDYSGCHVYVSQIPWRVDWKSYRWAIRKLSEYQIMKKCMHNET